MQLTKTTLATANLSSRSKERRLERMQPPQLNPFITNNARLGQECTCNWHIITPQQTTVRWRLSETKCVNALWRKKLCKALLRLIVGNSLPGEKPFNKANQTPVYYSHKCKELPRKRPASIESPQNFDRTLRSWQRWRVRRQWDICQGNPFSQVSRHWEVK